MNHETNRAPAAPDLLPCECGGPVVTTYDRMGLATCGWARCRACGAEEYSETGGEQGAIEAWNKARTATAPVPASTGREPIYQVASIVTPGGWVDCSRSATEGYAKAGYATRTVFAARELDADAERRATPVHFYRQKDAGAHWIEISAEQVDLVRSGVTASCYEFRTLYDRATAESAPASAASEFGTSPITDPDYRAAQAGLDKRASAILENAASAASELRRCSKFGHRCNCPASAPCPAAPSNSPVGAKEQDK